MHPAQILEIYRRPTQITRAMELYRYGLDLKNLLFAIPKAIAFREMFRFRMRRKAKFSHVDDHAG